MSVSCSSSEDDHRHRRARSRVRKDVKGSKKRPQRHSYGGESSEESPHMRKRIRSKRKDGSKVVRKTHKKKKLRREASMSSMSSVSYTCQVGSTSSYESEFGSHRDRSKRKEKQKGKLEKVRSGTKRSRYRSMSHSSCSRSSEGNEYGCEKKKTDENNSKRLRSVIMVIEKEGRVSDKEEHKEEIVYDNDDYPSCRSNDSNEGGHKRELDHPSNVLSDKKVMGEDENGEEPIVSNIRTTELTESFEDVEGQYNTSNPSCYGVGTNDSVKEKFGEESSGVNGDELESILRRRALENLRRFRGGLRSNAKSPACKTDKSEGEVKQPSPAKAELGQIYLPKEDCVKIVGAKSPKEDSAKSVGVTQVPKEINVPPRRDSKFYLQHSENNVSGKDAGHQAGSAKQEFACAPAQVAIDGKPNEKVNSAVVSVTNGLQLNTSALQHNSLNTHKSLKQRPSSDKSHQADLLGTESALVKSAVVTQTMTPTNTNIDVDIKNACSSGAPEVSSCLNSSLAVNRSGKPQDEITEGSQFEQKTMTVMRGGEMVQVYVATCLIFCITLHRSFCMTLQGSKVYGLIFTLLRFDL